MGFHFSVSWLLNLPEVVNQSHWKYNLMRCNLSGSPFPFLWHHLDSIWISHFFSIHIVSLSHALGQVCSSLPDLVCCLTINMCQSVTSALPRGASFWFIHSHSHFLTHCPRLSFQNFCCLVMDILLLFISLWLF